MASVFLFCPDLALVEVEDNKRGQVLVSAVQGKKNIFLDSLTMDRMYQFHMMSGLNLIPNMPISIIMKQQKGYVKFHGYYRYSL